MSGTPDKSSPCTAATEANSNDEASEALCTSSRGTQPSFFSESKFSEALMSDKPENTLHGDEQKLEAGQKKEQKNKEKRKKHRPKVVEVEKPERKSKMEIPMPPQTPKQKSPGKKKERVIGRRTFPRKKTLENSLPEDEWEEAGDGLQASVHETINPSRRMLIDEEELFAEMDVDYWESEQIEEDLPAKSTNIYTDVNIKIDGLLQELAKLPQKSFSPLLIKADLLQLNIESSVDTLKYIVDSIKIPSLLYSLNQARRSMTLCKTKGRHKLGEGPNHSTYKVLEEFIYVLKKFLPSIILKYDLPRGTGHMFNNGQGGRNRSISGSKEPRDKAKRTSKSNANLRFHRIEASPTTPMICNFVVNGQIAQNFEHVNLTLSQDNNNTMQLAFQDVVDNLRFVDINKDCDLDALVESQTALVPSFGGGAIIPYNNFFKQVKQKPHRVEVLLDPETNRLWKLLQGDECENDLGMDFCKLKWWENERRVFLGRAKSFIARMNLILGDRRFSPWKGSIVDSVVGVFLTQNVSDHLSSSAFMSLAAKFPVQIRGHAGENSLKKLDECEETSADAMKLANEVPTLEIQQNEDLLEALATQPYNLCNFFSSATTERCENSLNMDVDVCIPKNVANISKAFGENVQNECRDLPHDLSNLNDHPVDTTDVEMRRKVYHDNDKKERSCESLDSINWEAVRNADVKQISDCIRERGMNNLLAERIKDFLNRLVRDHGSIDLEWLRNICPDDAKKYLLSIWGLGLKSVECVRLLALQHVAFPVDTNVARISVRLGWVPLKPLPGFLQLHLLEQYPIMDSVQKYIWPRLCKLDQKELYELHYHMITFGKVFCTKSRPNCNICPMKGECKHFNSAKLALPAPAETQFKSSSLLDTSLSGSISFNPTLEIQYDESNVSGLLNGNSNPIIEYPPSPIIESPPPSPPHETARIIKKPLPSPPPETIHILDADMEDAFCEGDEIPMIELNFEQFGQNLQKLVQEKDMTACDNDVSKALVELSAEAASIPIRKLKNISGLRTEHLVYELPDSHVLLKKMDRREPDDPSPYLIAIWTPGETAQSTEPPESCCETQEACRLCETETCFACNNRRELEAQTVRGTFLIPCRTAMKGRFPLNGTYFQINEVFADHDSSRIPIRIPRSLLWNLPRRTAYFGTSVAAIFRGFVATEPIQDCFSRGFICTRGFDRITREPKPLYARLHLPKSKALNNKKPWTKREE